MAKGEMALDNKLRNMIYNHITTYPGVSFSILKNIFGITEGALRYHLDYLERCDKISSGLQKGVRCYYPHQHMINVPKRSTEDLELHKLTSQQELVLTTIKHYPGITQKDLVSRTRLNRFQVSRGLGKLQSLNLVKSTQVGRNVCYEYVPDDELKFKIIKKLVIKLLRDEIDEQTFLRLKRRLNE